MAGAAVTISVMGFIGGRQYHGRVHRSARPHVILSALVRVSACGASGVIAVEGRCQNSSAGLFMFGIRQTTVVHAGG